MVRQCLAQMPLMRPEPFYIGPELGDVVGVNVDAMAAADDSSYHPQGYNNNGMQAQSTHSYPSYQPYNTVSTPLVTKPLRRRPPAHIYVGRPVRPGTFLSKKFHLINPLVSARPSLFG